MKDFVPLFQTALWVMFCIGVMVFLRKEIKLLRENIAVRIQKGSGFKIGPIEIGDLKNELNIIKDDIASTNEMVSTLFLTTMSEPMYLNLCKLSTNDFGSFEMNNGLERELYHLRTIGYIDCLSIQAIPKKGNNLSDFATTTSTGKQFIELRSIIINHGKKYT